MKLFLVSLIAACFFLEHGQSHTTTNNTPEPSATTLEPTDTTPNPTDTTPELTHTTPKPTDTTPKPTDTTPKPTDTTPKPTDTTPKPADTTPKPTSKSTLAPHITTIKRMTKTVFTTPSRDACLSNPCQNGGNCTNHPGGGYKCSCKHYFAGYNCVTDIFHPCRSHPCTNGGKCIEIGNCSQEFHCICKHGFTGKLCSVHVDTLVLNITAREKLNSVYIDGVEVPELDYSANWSKVVTINVPITTRLIAIMGVNIHDTCAGILMSESNGYILSDSINWKCYVGATHGWADLSYDDSNWPPAHVVGQNEAVPGCPSMEGVPSIQSTAKWIWTTHSVGHDLVVYCRGYVDICITKPCQNGGTCNKNGLKLCSCIPGFTGQFCEKVGYTTFGITASEKLNDLYIDGVRMSLQNSTIEQKMDKFQLHPTVRQIAVMASDVNNPSSNKECFGILGSSEGPVPMLTNSAMWKCIRDPVVAWHQLDHDDSKWPAAKGFQYNNESRCPEMNPIAGIHPQAEWIWTSPYPHWDLLVFCRGYTNLCHKGVKICQNGGVCNPTKSSVCTCKEGYTGTYCELKIGVDIAGPEEVCPSDQ